MFDYIEFDEGMDDEDFEDFVGYGHGFNVYEAINTLHAPEIILNQLTQNFEQIGSDQVKSRIEEQHNKLTEVIGELKKLDEEIKKPGSVI